MSAKKVCQIGIGFPAGSQKTVYFCASALARRVISGTHSALVKKLFIHSKPHLPLAV